MKKLKGALLGLAVGVALAALYLLQPAFLGEVELKALDARFRLRGPRAVPEGVVIVAADETSIDRIGRWPWPHETYARILRTISEAGALAIGLDVIWSEPERCPSDPGALPGAIGDAGNVVAGYFLREDAPAGAGAPGGPPTAASPPPNVEASALTWRQRSAEASVEMLTGRGTETNLDEITLTGLELY